MNRRASYRRYATDGVPHGRGDEPWVNPVEIKNTFNSADILPNNRVIFDIGGNRFRIVVVILYRRGIVYIRFVGTHAQYDKIDATTV